MPSEYKPLVNIGSQKCAQKCLQAYNKSITFINIASINEVKWCSLLPYTYVTSVEDVSPYLNAMSYKENCMILIIENCMPESA